MPHPGLEIREFPDRAGFHAAGEINVTTRSLWEQALGRLGEYRGTIRLDLSGLVFSDVAGAGALAVSVERLADRQRVVLEQPPPSLRRALQIFWPDTAALEVVT